MGVDAVLLRVEGNGSSLYHWQEADNIVCDPTCHRVAGQAHLALQGVQTSSFYGDNVCMEGASPSKFGTPAHWTAHDPRTFCGLSYGIQWTAHSGVIAGNLWIHLWDYYVVCHGDSGSLARIPSGNGTDPVVGVISRAGDSLSPFDPGNCYQRHTGSMYPATVQVSSFPLIHSYFLSTRGMNLQPMQ